MQRDRPEPQPALPVIMMKKSASDFSNRPLKGQRGFDVCGRTPLITCTLSTAFIGPKNPARLEIIHIKSISESPRRIIWYVQTERVGATRRYASVCTFAACSLKISPSVEGHGLH